MTKMYVQGSGDTAKDNYLISPVQRALRLLETIASGGETANVSALAARLGINRVTLKRLLDTLEHEGMIEPVARRGGHRIGTRFLALAAAVLGERDLVRLAQPILSELASRTGLSAYLTMLSEADIVYLLQELPDTPLVSNIRVGSRVPAHFTAPGRVLLAGLSPSARRTLLGEEPFAKATEQTATGHEELDQIIAEDEARGCAWSFSAYEIGVTACAAPVRDSGGKVVAAISVAGPDSGFAPERRGEIEKAVSDAARLLARMAGSGSARARNP